MRCLLLHIIFILLPFCAIAQRDSTLQPSVLSDTIIESDPIGIKGYEPYADSLLQYHEYGIASWYGENWKGRMTSSGQRFSPDSMTAAHKRLPLGTVVRVTNLKNDSVIYVKITDRLPRSSKRSIDLTPKAAKRLNFYSRGLTEVKIEVVGTAPIYKKPKTPPQKKTATHAVH